jgi:hypothetical protein
MKTAMATTLAAPAPGRASLSCETVLEALKSIEVPVLNGRNNTRTQGAEQVNQPFADTSLCKTTFADHPFQTTLSAHIFFS